MLGYASTGFKTVYQAVPFFFQVNRPGVPGFVPFPRPALGIYGFGRTGFARLYLEANPDNSLKDILVLRPVIQALTLIGSTGSVGHTRSSDLDYWVIVDKRSLDDGQVDYLEKKCRSIQAWAQARHGAEVHFFLMDPQDIRDLKLGPLDEESSGEVMPRLVMEEYYRTLLHVAGRMPLWWTTPPGASPEAYNRLARVADDILMTTFQAEDFIDLGFPENPGPREYLGAAMWQAHKAQRDPFKALLKMLLIKEQVDSGLKAPLLCDQVKAAVVAAESVDQMPVDPYYLTIRRVIDNADSHLDLVRTAAWFKIHHPFDHVPPTPQSTKARLMENLRKEWNWPAEKVQDLMQYSWWTQARRLALGEELKAVLLDLFSHVAARLRQDYGAEVMFQDDNLARLNAQILSRYADHSTKVEELPSVFHRQGMPKDMNLVWTEGAWRLCESAGVDEDYFYSNPRLVRVAAWLVQNQLWGPGVRLRLRPGHRPVKIGAVLGVIALFARLFPVVNFADGANLGLLSRPVGPKALVVNLEEGAVTTRPLTVDVVYRTSLGEMHVEGLGPLGFPGAEGFTLVAQWAAEHHDGPVDQLIPFVPPGPDQEEMELGLKAALRRYRGRGPQIRKSKVRLDLD
jgi:adenylate cyclase